VTLVGHTEPGQGPVTTQVAERRLRMAAPVTAPGPGLLAPLAGSVVLLLFACCLLLLFLTRDYRQALYGGGGTVAALVSAAVGLVVARRQPRNPIGWLLLGWALLVPVVGVALLYSVLDYRIHHGALPAGQVAVVAQAAAFLVAAASGLAVLLFPDGALPSRWWRGAALAFLVCCALFAVHQFVDQAAAATQTLIAHQPGS